MKKAKQKEGKAMAVNISIKGRPSTEEILEALSCEREIFKSMFREILDNEDDGKISKMKVEKDLIRSQLKEMRQLPYLCDSLMSILYFALTDLDKQGEVTIKYDPDLPYIEINSTQKMKIVCEHGGEGRPICPPHPPVKK